MNPVIDDIALSKKVSDSYLNYSISVIADRALPDFRDGLKPVARRILYAIYKMHIRKNTPHKKCARIVGEVLGKFHPHSDLAVYGALVRMARDFTMMYPLIDGQGSFGSIDDNAAAMRYTEARLEKISELLLDDLEFNTVDFIDNFDASLKEPVILPARFPNLLVNGATGIAVGMKTDIPSHNLGEISEALVLLIDNPNATIQDILKCIKGPDFPTGGFIVFDTPKEELYSSGQGGIKIRAKIEEIDIKRKNGLQITEIPYQVSKEEVMQQIIKLVKEKKLEGVLDLRDETDRDGLKIVIEFSRKVEFEKIVKILYRKTKLEKRFRCQFLALDNGGPKLFNIEEFLKSFLKFRVETTKRYFTYKITEKKKRQNILLGRLKIIDNIDYVIKLIRRSNSNDEIREGLISKLGLNKEQADSVLETILSRLSKHEESSIKQELKTLKIEINEMETILSTEKNILKYIKKDTLEIKDKFYKKRLSKILKK